MSTVEKLTQKEIDLIAVAASIASGCLPCLLQHAKAVRDAGGSEVELLDATKIALDVRDNTTEIMAETLLGNHYYEYPRKTLSTSIKKPVDHLVALAAAHTCNSVAGMEYHLTEAKVAGTSMCRIQTALEISRAIRKEAIDITDVKFENLIGPIQGIIENTDKPKIPVPPPCVCG